MRPVGYPSEPKHLWNTFYDLTQIPRPSKKEEKVVEYLVNLAKENNWECKVDEVLNVIIYVPATKGFESKETVMLQGHTDMVCDKTADSNHDFDNDPIKLQIIDGWVSGTDTTLGSDNGFGVACAIAAAIDPEVEHPSLELLFTSDEETGLNGALNIKKEWFNSKKLVNIDTEEWGSLYIGCAGGVDYTLNGEFKLDQKNIEGHKLSISGLCGGHSGIDIHTGRSNAISLLGTFLNKHKNVLQVSEFFGGKAHNIIPRDAYVTFSTDLSEAELNGIIESYYEEIIGFINERDKKVGFSLTKENLTHVMTCSESNRLINLLNIFPHGAHGYIWDSKEPLVSFSNNLAEFKTDNGKLFIQTSLRFFDRNELIKLEEQIKSIAESFELQLENNSEYPSWKPNFDNKLLDHVKELYKSSFDIDPEVKAIHAGLECGILLDTLGDLDAISFGPDITGAHSPTEKMEIKSATQCYDLLKIILKNI